MIGRMRALIGASVVVVLGAGIGIGVLLGGSSNDKPASPAAAAATVTSAASFTLNGTFTLKLGAFQWNHGADGNTPCAGYQGYADIAAGTPVVITDQGGAVIATGQLGTGSATVDTTTGRATQCTFTFAVTAVPNRPFYGVTVSHRGTVTYSAAQARGGQAALTLG